MRILFNTQSKKYLQFVLVVLLSGTVLMACGPDRNTTNGNTKNRQEQEVDSVLANNQSKATPGTTGKPIMPKRPAGFPIDINHTEGQVLVVIDTSDWRGSIGDSIQNILLQDMYGYPQAEPMFEVLRVDPRNFQGTFKKYYNVLVVGNVNSTTPSGSALRALLGEKNVSQANSDKAAPYYVNSDVFVKGQNILYLLGKSDAEVKDKLYKHKKDIANFFDQKIMEFLAEYYSYKPYDKTLTGIVKRATGIDFQVPYGYILAKEADGFAWFRIPDEEVDRNLIVASVPYTSEDQFTDRYLRSLRDSLGENLVKVKGDTNHYMMSQDYMPLMSNAVQLNGKYARLCKGLWKLKDNSMGGPFVGYALVSEDGKSLYYIESFVYSPGRSKRKEMRTNRAIISNIGG